MANYVSFIHRLLKIGAKATHDERVSEQRFCTRTNRARVKLYPHLSLTHVEKGKGGGRGDREEERPESVGYILLGV